MKKILTLFTILLFAVTVSAEDAEFDPATNVLNIPTVRVGGSSIYDVKLQLNSAGGFALIDYSPTPPNSSTHVYYFNLYNDYGSDNQWHAGVEDHLINFNTRQATLETNSAYIDLYGVNGMEAINPDDIESFTKWTWTATLHEKTNLTGGSLLDLQDHQITVTVQAVSATRLEFTWNFDRNHMASHMNLVIQFQGS